MVRTPQKRPPKPAHVGTLGEHRQHAMTLWVYCLNHDCRHNARADLELLCASYGDDTTVSDFVALSRCTKCGGRWPEIAITITPESPRSWPGPKASPNRKLLFGRPDAGLAIATNLEHAALFL
jgi:hypothetical protein